MTDRIMRELLPEAIEDMERLSIERHRERKGETRSTETLNAGVGVAPKGVAAPAPFEEEADHD